MLVLSRKVNESIMIGEGIEVRIIDITAKSIKIGIEAPRDIAVHRKEVFEAIKNENLNAVPLGNVVSLFEFFNSQKNK